MNDATPYDHVGDVEAAIARMRSFHQSGTTLPLAYRRQALVRMREYLRAHEAEVLEALRQDLGKAPFEAYGTELGIVYDEIRLCLAKLGSWARPRRVSTPLVHFRSNSKVYPGPLGVVLVLSPWNYPLQLALVPLVDALAAGNCVALKPSRASQATSAFLLKMIAELFPSTYVCGFPGSADMNDWLLQVRFDHIFFTGSTRIGRAVMEAAARYLTPVTLELGGKSPCIVDKSAHIKRAAQRIAWGKGINSGQTCVAPDYFLVHENVADELIKQLDLCFHRYYGQDILACEEWPRIINRHHFDRLRGLIDTHSPAASIAFGGRSDEGSLRIEPTCMVGVGLNDPVMKEEIFGPLLPILTFKTLDEAFEIIRCFEKPLATYVFAEDKAVWHRVIAEVPFGGATINDVVIHLANNHMGFGGVGHSGMGSYHGKAGFDCFSHYKSTLRKGTLLEIPVRTPPFRDKIKLLRLLMR
ncbi:MAG: aldehyde dehydrogenase [Coriobacteriaceae bacterium]|jgi:aldehyde dehydrogenase (NAD+)|nr:aldehyde dehydrogenase [Coriobacteriaceae bacterium]